MSPDPAAHQPTSQPVWRPLRILELLGGLVVLVLAVGVTAAVLLRLLGRATTGVVELGALSMLVLVLLAAPAVAARDQHVRLELLDFFAGPRLLRILEHFGSLIQLLVTGLLILAVWQVLQSDLSRGTTIGGELRLSRWWLSGFALIGLIALALGVGNHWSRGWRQSRPTGRADLPGVEDRKD